MAGRSTRAHNRNAGSNAWKAIGPEQSAGEIKESKNLIAS